jgi:putative ABC transport system substrate-binding protein
LTIPADGMLYDARKQIADLAIAYHLPMIGAVREMAEAGLLLSFGPELSDLFRRAGVYIDKIIKGVKPADLPVERPTKFNLVVNMTTARAIGVTIPDSTQLLADKIIE